MRKSNIVWNIVCVLSIADILQACNHQQSHTPAAYTMRAVVLVLLLCAAALAAHADITEVMGSKVRCCPRLPFSPELVKWLLNPRGAGNPPRTNFLSQHQACS